MAFFTQDTQHIFILRFHNGQRH